MMYRLEERDFLLSRDFGRMQRFSSPSLIVPRRTKSFFLVSRVRMSDATRELVPSKTTKAGRSGIEGGGKALSSSSLRPRLSLLSETQRLLREATSCVLDKTARLRATVSSYSFPFLFVFWNLCETRKRKKLGLPPVFVWVVYEKSNHLIPLNKVSKTHEKCRQNKKKKETHIYNY